MGLSRLPRLKEQHWLKYSKHCIFGGNPRHCQQLIEWIKQSAPINNTEGKDEGCTFWTITKLCFFKETSVVWFWMFINMRQKSFKLIKKNQFSLYE